MLAAGSTRLNATGLTLGYDQRVISENLDVVIPDRSFTVIVGANGCGKSTLLRALSRMLKPKHGNVYLDGKAITAMPSKEVARRLGLLPQTPIAPDGITVADLVGRGRYPHQRLLRQWSHNDESVVRRAMDSTGVLDLADWHVDELSGGQRQRVSFARALAAKPTVLLADEPVSMLDVSIRLEMLALLNDLRDRLRLALLYITHDIASARYFADEILVMYAGQIVERGPAEEITQRPKHPYTQLLISSAPDPDNLGSSLKSGANRNPRKAVEGVATVGCPFNPRCPRADDQCREENPALIQLTSARAAACWHIDESDL